jgi:hypothetical protein
MTDILFEPKFKNVYKYTEVIKTDKFIVVTNNIRESSRFSNLLFSTLIEFDIDYLEDSEDFCAYSFDLEDLDQIKTIIEKYNIKTLEIK